jgi:hypothetical protein
MARRCFRAVVARGASVWRFSRSHSRVVGGKQPPGRSRSPHPAKADSSSQARGLPSYVRVGAKVFFAFLRAVHRGQPDDLFPARDYRHEEGGKGECPQSPQAMDTGSLACSSGSARARSSASRFCREHQTSGGASLFCRFQIRSRGPVPARRNETAVIGLRCAGYSSSSYGFTRWSSPRSCLRCADSSRPARCMP